MTRESEIIEELKKSLTEHQEELKRIAASALEIATVVRVQKAHVYISVGGNVMRVEKPKAKVEAGNGVLVFSETKQIVEVMDFPPTGTIGYVEALMDNGEAEVVVNGNPAVVQVGDSKAQKGDRVMIDASESVILRNLGKLSRKYALDDVPNITWDDIGGLEEAKQAMIEAVELPHKNKKIFDFYGKRSPKGVLLYGPPGCGKTLLAKAAANSLAKIYKESGAAASSFIYIKGPELLNKYVGESEASIRSLFERTREHKAKHGYPAVLFIDEADAILAERGGRGSISGMEQTIVPMFLAEMDGMEDSGAFIILATNRPDSLDPAVGRDGRIDRKIKVTRPTKASTADIVNLNLKKTPLGKGVKREDLATCVVTELFSPSRILYTVKTTEGDANVTLAHMVNGGMIAGVVDAAMTIAIRRDLASGKMTGVTREDIIEAVNLIDTQSRDLNHNNEMQEMVEPYRDQVLQIVKVAA